MSTYDALRHRMAVARVSEVAMTNFSYLVTGCVLGWLLRPASEKLWAWINTKLDEWADV